MFTSDDVGDDAARNRCCHAVSAAAIQRRICHAYNEIEMSYHAGGHFRMSVMSLSLCLVNV